MYGRLAFVTALFLHLNINVFASRLYEMTVTMVSRGNIKQAMTEGIQYWIGFLFCSFTPSCMIYLLV